MLRRQAATLSMVKDAGRITAPLPSELRPTRQMGAGASHWATLDDCTPDQPNPPRSPAHSSRSLTGVIQVHPDGDSLPATAPRFGATPGRQNLRRSGGKQPAAGSPGSTPVRGRPWSCPTGMLRKAKSKDTQRPGPYPDRAASSGRIADDSLSGRTSDLLGGRCWS